MTTSARHPLTFLLRPTCRALASLLLAMLPFAAGCDLLENGTEPTPIGREVVYDALGASDTIGYGSSNPCLPLIDCTTGPGYVQQVTRRLQADGRQVSLRNHGWPGAVLSPETQALLQSMGGCQAQGTDVCRNLLLEGAPYVRRSATLVTMFIGANDVNAIGRAVRSGRTGGLDQAAFIQSQIEKFARDIQEAATTIRSRAPEARLIVLNLPNMANTPYASGFTVAEKRVLQQLSVGFSAGINALAGQNAVVVDLMCDGNFYNPALFSSDGFHPNDTGYNYLTERVYSAVTGSVTAPRSSCGFMTVF